MEITKITYPTEFNKIKDIENDNIDVIVELEDCNNTKKFNTTDGK